MTDPWWKPVLTDSAWCNEMRNDYPDAAGLSDDEIRDKFADDRKYAVTWDHVGDAYEQFEKLADAYLAKIADDERRRREYSS